MILSLWSRLTWTLFICFTAFHLIANHRAVSVVALETLNKNRLHILMQHYLANGSGLTVHYVNIREPILTSEEVAEEGLCFMLLFQFMFCHTSTQGQHVSCPMTLAARSTGYSQSQFVSLSTFLSTTFFRTLTVVMSTGVLPQLMEKDSKSSSLNIIAPQKMVNMHIV